MEMIFDIREDVSFVLKNDTAAAPAHTGQPEQATFLAYGVETIIGNAELSKLE